MGVVWRGWWRWHGEGSGGGTEKAAHVEGGQMPDSVGGTSAWVGSHWGYDALNHIKPY